jgi:tRNA (mo5U34)-methyltransferase
MDISPVSCMVSTSATLLACMGHLTGNRQDLQKRVGEHPFWHHTIEIMPGAVTPGWFDLRPVANRMPWPDVKGKRCLDIGTFDGFSAFEMGRRGAAQVVAIDAADRLLWG